MTLSVTKSPTLPKLAVGQAQPQQTLNVAPAPQPQPLAVAQPQQAPPIATVGKLGETPVDVAQSQKQSKGQDVAANIVHAQLDHSNSGGEKGLSDDDILNGIMAQNPDSPIHDSISQAISDGLTSTDILNGMIDQNGGDHVRKAVQEQRNKQQYGVSNPNFFDKMSSNIGDFGIGFLKSAGQTVQNIGNFGDQILGGITGQQQTQGQQQAGQQINQFLQPTNTAQKIGGYAENAAEFLAPGGAELKAGQLVDKGVEALNMGEKASGALRFLGKSGISATSSGLVTAAQTGDSKQAGAAAAIGGVLPGFSLFGSKLLKGTASMLSGVDKQVITRAIENPDAVLSAIGKVGSPGAQKELVDKGVEALTNYQQAAGKQFGEEVSKMTASAPIDKNVVKDTFSASVDKFGGKINAKGELEFGDSQLTRTDKTALQNAWDDIKSWKDATPQGYDRLRQAIGNYMKDFKIQGNPRANAILGDVKQALTSEMDAKIPTYQGTRQAYGEAQDVIDNIKSELQLSGTAKTSTKINNLMRIFRKDPELQSNIIKVMGQENGNKFLNDISGSILSEWLPHSAFRKGIEGLLGTAGAVGLGHAAGALTGGAGLLVGAAATSPRIIGTGAALAGKAAQAGVPGLLRKGISKGVGGLLTK